MSFPTNSNWEARSVGELASCSPQPLRVFLFYEKSIAHVVEKEENSLTQNVELTYYQIVQQTTISEKDSIGFDLDRKCQWIHSIFTRLGSVQLRPEDNPERCDLVRERDGAFCQKHRMIADLVAKGSN